MPIYTYRCKDCEHEFEIRQRMSDDPLTECPVCDGEIRRVVNSVGVVFKGQGFYITDNRGGKNATLSTNGKDSSTSSSSDKAEPTSTASDTSKPKTETAAA
ncbi:MAG: FmdB family transcriptional regulator [Ardenticatenaceae bacterium]|nr:FmdB family transcriptional regulator [Ardenticatenaceae bacterium]